MSEVQNAVRKAIPLCGIVLVLGSIAIGQTASHRLVTHSTPDAPASNSVPARQELVALVQDFLKNVPTNERSTFDRFFADDVIYTRGTGQVISKKDILSDTGNTTAPRANATYSGKDFTLHQYGEVAVVNFRLLMRATENDKPVTRAFRNTGTFMKRKGRWQAVAWQATPILDPQ